MTLVLPLASPTSRAPRLARVRALPGWDALAVGALTLLWAGTLAAGIASLPLQLWDESRNANNALEMARFGHWLTPTYAGVVDHWNTKPPLMIWAMAVLLKLGVAPLAAVRAPAMLAALATVLTLYGVLRVGLKDRLAAVAAGVLLLGATLYIGPHGARTGDYDAPESGFILAYVACAWAALETGRARWVAGVAAFLSLGVLTKGVAAVLPLPGLALYALTRPAQLQRFLRDPRAWAAVGGAAAVIGGYYLSREAYDPGYLRAVATNELGGRFLQVTENHRGGWDYYLRILLNEAEPLSLLAVAAPLALRRASPRRRGLALACGLAALSLLVVLSSSRSKMEWYATPICPLLAMVAALAVSEMVSRTAGGSAEARRARAVWLRTATAAGLAGTALWGLWWGSTLAARRAAQPWNVQLRYDAMLAAARPGRLGGQPVTVIDTGFYNDAGFAAYDPMLKFYADAARAQGVAVRVLHTDADLDAGAQVGTCDPKALRMLRDDYRLATVAVAQGCRILRVIDDAP